MKVKPGKRFKITILNKTYSAVITHVNKNLYIVDFYLDGEFETSKVVKDDFFKDNKDIIDWGVGK